MEKIRFINQKPNYLYKSILDYAPQLNFLQIKMAMRKKNIKVNGKKVTDNIALLGGEQIEVFLPDKKEKQIEVIYEDDNLIVANKPVGLETTLKDKVFTNSKCLEEYFNAKAVHRLDKNTAGLVILAKNQNAENGLTSAFKLKQIDKYYLAVALNNFKEKEAELSAYWSKEENEVKISKEEILNSIQIITSYKVLKQKNELSLLEVKLVTGKTHQIRAHLAFVCHPILGDGKYGNKKINKKFNLSKQLLCAYKIVFNFPETSPLFYLNKVKCEIDKKIYNKYFV